MKKFNLKFAFYLIVVITLTLGVSISLQFVLASWQAPSNNPPLDNMPKPINEGVDSQIKSGKLGIGSDFLVGTDTFFVDDTNTRVGIGTINPKNTLHVAANGEILLEDNSVGIEFRDLGQNRTPGIDDYDFAIKSWKGELHFSRRATPSDTWKKSMYLQQSGTIAVCNGTCGTQNTANGAGDLYVERFLEVDGGCFGANSCDADIAEEFETNAGMEAGDLVVLDASKFKKLKLTNKQYDTNVVGVISTKPTIVIGQEKRNRPLPLALNGVVPVKVTTENGTIKVGDFLTSSSIQGRAMKCKISTPEEKMQCFGTIIGKAMEKCNDELCIINTIVTLQ